ncbi:hypothetical protein EB118_18330 [bacterium]|nr:hypothetical protein [Synechococcaceae bacterium WB6_1A_059]NDG32018.1 hypothetical protein [bacterium]NDG79248.1 hypothetical protein [Synechococcaceae bacterium WB8_1B_057]
MPRLSLYRPEKSNDFRFLDRAINEQFQIGGTDIYVHKYVGPNSPQQGESSPVQPNQSNSIPELGIQDLLLLENRDRKYDQDVYIIRGIYTLQDVDFNLSQFGLFLQNDNIMITFHLRSSFEALGRKLIAGDVLELPHQKDEYALDDGLTALKRFYVISEVTRPASGYSQTWYPHLIRAKCQPLVDTQEFKEILDKDSGADDGITLRNLLSDYQRSIEINNQVILQAEEDVPKSGYETRHFYIIPEDDKGLADVQDTTDLEIDASSTMINAAAVLKTPNKNYYVGWLTGDGVPPNGSPYNFGIVFPSNAIAGEFFLRTDYLPNRMYRYDGRNWVRFEDDVRMTISTQGDTQATDPALVRRKLKASFVNNLNTSTIAGQIVPERQSLSKALKPRADL